MSAIAGCAQWQTSIIEDGGTPSPLSFAQISELPVVNNLYAQSREQWLAGRTDQAGTSLERALRMEPDNGYLWLGLAQIAMAMQDSAKAKEFGSRAYSFAAGDARLKSAVSSFLNTF